jgi:hypothetical protein
MDGVWIGEWNLLNTYKSLSLIHTLYNSQQHALTLLSLLYVHGLLPGNGFQRRRFLSFRVHVLTGRRLSHN